MKMFANRFDFPLQSESGFRFRPSYGIQINGGNFVRKPTYGDVRLANGNSSDIKN